MSQQNNQQNKQQHNQQHHNQGNRPQQQPQIQPVVDQGPVAKVEMAVTKFPVRKEDLKQVLTRLVGEVMSGQRQPETARVALHDWYHSLTSEEQHAFKAGRIQADETMNWFKGVVEILAQELPSLYVA